MPVQKTGSSVTVTLPVGAPTPVGTTLYCTVTDWPTTDGSGLSDVIVVVVSALLTPTLSLHALLPSLVSVLLLFGSTLQLPPPRGFVYVTGLTGVAVNATSKEPLAVPSATVPALAVQVSSLLAMAQLTL